MISWPSIEKPLSVSLTSFGERAADRVVLQQERHRVRVAERVVDRDQLDAGLLAPGEERPGERPADPAEAVDADPYRHVILRLRWITCADL